MTRQMEMIERFQDSENIRGSFGTPASLGSSSKECFIQGFHELLMATVLWRKSEAGEPSLVTYYDQVKMAAHPKALGFGSLPFPRKESTLGAQPLC